MWSRLQILESGIYRRILALTVVVATFTLAASRLSISVPNLRGTGCVGVVVFTSEPTVFACAKAGHERSKGCHSSWFILDELSYEPFVLDTMLKSGQGFDIRTVDNLVLLGQESVPKLLGRFFEVLCDAV